MKLTSKLFASLILSLSALSAQATVTQVIVPPNDPTDVQVTVSTPYSYTYDVNGTFDSAVKKIVGAVLNIVLKDPNNGNESYQLVIGTAPTADTTNGGNINNGNAVNSTDYTLQTSTSLADLQADGQLKFTLTALTGEFFFASSGLTLSLDDIATGTPNAVPEPMTLGLFAIALLGLGFARRRQN